MFEIDDDPTPTGSPPPPSSGTYVVRSKTRTQPAPIPICPIWLRWSMRLTLLLGLAMTIYGYKHRNKLPDATEIVPALRFEPKQQESDLEPFDFKYGRETYTVEPIADYQIAGVIVTHNNPTGIGDIYHDADSVDFKDLCLLWGSNVIDNNFHNITFWSEPWSCHMKADDHQVFRQFDPDKISNNHLLSDDPKVRKTISRARIGDQIQLSGYLVNYYPKGLPYMSRKSSLVRTDTGNGACEVMFVTDATILEVGARGGYYIYRTGLVLLIAVLLIKLGLFFFLPVHHYRKIYG